MTNGVCHANVLTCLKNAFFGKVSLSRLANDRGADMQVLTVSELGEVSADLGAQQVCLKGVLIVEGNTCYIVSDQDNAQRRIYIIGDNIIDSLLNEAPCYIGGDRLYEDEVSVKGLLEYRPSDRQYYLSNLNEITLYRDGETFHIRPH